MDRFVDSDIRRELLIRFLEKHKLPFTITIEAGRKRTNDQNRLQRKWITEIAEQLPDQPAEWWRGYCKLHFGVPIMRNESEGFRQTYDEVIRPLPYEQKIKLMMIPLDLPVTRIMNTRQHTAYLDQVHKHFLEQGLALTDPGDLLIQAHARAA